MLCFAGSLQHKDSWLPCTEIYYRRPCEGAAQKPMVLKFKVVCNYCFCGMIKVALEARRWNNFQHFLPEYFLSVTELWCLASSQFTLYVEFWPGQFYCVWRQKETIYNNYISCSAIFLSCMVANNHKDQRGSSKNTLWFFMAYDCRGIYIHIYM